MKWLIVDKEDNSVLLEGSNLAEARSLLSSRVSSKFLREQYRIVPEGAIMESMSFGDLKGIGKPLISFNEYMPVDESANNFVLAFFLDRRYDAAVRDWVAVLANSPWMVNISFNPVDRFPGYTAVYAEIPDSVLSTAKVVSTIRAFANALGIPDSE
ncbi:MAG: hypothetical protein D6698_14070, partial [Gammaproteobacteria bacterium]